MYVFFLVILKCLKNKIIKIKAREYYQNNPVTKINGNYLLNEIKLHKDKEIDTLIKDSKKNKYLSKLKEEQVYYKHNNQKISIIIKLKKRASSFIYNVIAHCFVKIKKIIMLMMQGKLMKNDY